jgi:leucyl aminopeptidase (aminopeptidase T)
MRCSVFLPIAGVCALAATMACGPGAPAPPPADTPAPAAQPASPPPPPQADLAAVARTMVKAAMVKEGDKVLINGSVRDHALFEELAVEAMKVGAQPLIAVWSDRLARRSYDDVPAAFDSRPPAMELALLSVYDVQLSVEGGESDSALAGVPAARLAARDKAMLPLSAAFLERGIRAVNLGNGLYPTASLATRLGKPLSEVSTMFWKAAMVAPETLRARGEALRAALAAAREVTLSSANGTKIAFAVDTAKADVSDGTITVEKVKRGGLAMQTWLPAGELFVPVVPGTGEGTIVIDRTLQQGEIIEGLVLTISKGRLASMTAKKGLAALQAYYDASSGGKDLFSFIDLGLNPEATFPTDTGRVVWMAPGGVTIGLGDNTWWGGTNVSSLTFAGAVPGATLAADGKVIIENGVLK